MLKSEKTNILSLFNPISVLFYHFFTRMWSLILMKITLEDSIKPGLESSAKYKFVTNYQPL